MKKLSARMLAARRRREIKQFDRVVAVVGSKSAISRALGVTVQAVQWWRKDGVPPNRCAQLYRLSGGLVQCEQLREDFGQLPKVGG
jgi:DNA-binding transcriptional regulator YdaS (Cro superfamily)